MFDFLEVDPDFCVPGSVQIYYQSTRSITQFVLQALNSKARKQLCELYSKDIEKLENEFDLNISHW
ncbi:hypothetical protein [Aliifodinibius sp. S!AR15-10]|uniref:hypothetical protein n=1 Tax=Aliifodinibius sp. S!AR15-10 TaxID=2950437 RepID=UPI00287097EA|nr:hypothetical protein [Aliifodinibius sp. S!AR15-10]